MSSNKEYRCLEDFIRIYKSETCLWKFKSPDYHNRLKKNMAYAKLVEKWREVDPAATKSTILRKINNLRSSYRKELKKIKKSVESGVPEGQVYVPKLWYFKLLEFLSHQESLRNYRSDTRSDEDTSENDEQDKSNPTSTSVRHDSSGNEDDDDQPLKTPEGQTQVSRVSPIPGGVGTHHKPSTQLAIDTNALKNEILKSVKDHLNQQQKSEDRLDMFSKVVAMKLRDLDANQRRYAEKFINDVLFEAEGGNLDASFAFVRQVPNQPTAATPMVSCNQIRSSTGTGALSTTLTPSDSSCEQKFTVKQE